ncbi:MAG: BamA/TamA family outer membrane protein [Vicinamibacteria bacterium]
MKVISSRSYGMRASPACLLVVSAMATAATAQAVLPDPTALPVKDIFDVIRELRHKPPTSPPTADQYKKLMITAAPVIGYNPASGFGIGVAGNIAFFRGEPATTRISSLVTSLKVTTKDQVSFNAKINAFTAGNRWNIVSDNRAYWTNQDTYGLGTSTTPDQAVNVKFDYLRFYETGYRELRPSLFAGVGFLYSGYRNIEPNPENAPGTPAPAYVADSNQNGFPLDSQISAGTSVNFLVDSRDNFINPSRGYYADLKYQMYFSGFLGGTSTWQLSHADLRTYVRLNKDARQRLAFWFFGNLVTGGAAPYFDLPSTGDDTYGRSGRGYTQGRFRGERMLYGEVEYRWTITKNGLIGMVAFLNTETLSNRQANEKLFDSFATAGGVGLRLMMSKRSNTNLCVDYGRGEQGSDGVYFSIQEAF